MIIAWLKGDCTSALLASFPRRLIYYLVFIYYFCPPLVLRTSTGRSFRAIAMKLCRHITLGGIQSPSKNVGGQTPLGGIFSPNFFSRYRSENLPESCPGPRKK